MIDISKDLWSHSQSLKAAGFPAVWATPSNAHQCRGCVCVPPTLGISRRQGDINKAGCALSSALKLLLFSCWLFTASSPCTSWEGLMDAAMPPWGAHNESQHTFFFNLAVIADAVLFFFCLLLWCVNVKVELTEKVSSFNTLTGYHWLHLSIKSRLADSKSSRSGVQEADLTPAKSTWCPKSSFFYFFFLFFSLFVRQPMGKLTDEFMLATGLL